MPGAPIKLAEVQTRDGLEHEPREVIVGQPIPDIRRHQKRLIPVTTNEILSHAYMVINRPDDTVITRQPPTKRAVLRASGSSA